MALKFHVLHQSKKSRARVGRIETAHGIIDTPAFVPVATNGALKGVVDHSNIQLMFCNTYHLLVHPGTEAIAAMGGLHKFIHRNSPIITDSGGFQIFSLAYGSVAEEIKSCGKKKGSSSILEVTDEGVWFKSYRDGSKLFLSPEVSVQAQKDLGADIIIPLDELLPFHSDTTYFLSSCARTYVWEKRSLDYHKKDPRHQSMYGVIHGGIDPKQRKIGCAFVEDHPFDGFAIGGSLGRNLNEMVPIVDITTSYLSKDRPVHLLGIGDLPSIQATIGFGIDSFDSSYPTKAARHGLILSSQGPIKIANQAYTNDLSPIDPECTCLTCTSKISRAYLRHLFKVHEPNASIWASIHNLHYMQEFMKNIREQILHDRI
ncbi:tRNA guanosine(34) transglycosylase Tgt [Chlamydia abortus]|uniref:Queuine tRNA-ribosyltransferase n=1 Tax=Chlamydia abortus (strain DSM 27085 / S26/3) TaxID=218497 RepID=TGT_CHLAB|nr:tRNA guanosine(34) transglycosylase Tgt [Chlamydia abortus]Q5L5T1.1 RecName: Full=Queuine tRNA-ribosyltransferase; AltName: Full=Guanine insertion enzyme; AltName: Full=tRNA-guanine transglycosylase [Chlamydia abortus S26/3]ASD30703.1 tRNA-guanine(34) transglycosylase [Chlamydia abortus]AUS60029.1 tRNA-guanine transglycosylase [Chlamydia abortus]QRR31337.1 tRNA-guanosine(34) transglycosylase [Chlamydia abortus]CAH64006.1 putative queuine tRNA-ribosyltransferase [Chlamydia abortus S26/3]CED